ncbi:MAG: hypothetical protein ACOYXC_18680 [Candidatus Rifleibacteriota bacterium]
MTRIVFAILLIMLCGLLMPAWADQTRYIFPQNIRMSFADEIKKTEGKISLTAVIESLVGELKNIEVYFSSSKDLKILSNTTTLPKIKKGSLRKVKILAVRTGEKTDEMGSWIKMGVRYQPDYAAILAAVGDTGVYPDQNERQRLIDIVNRNSQSKEPYHEMIRFFIDSERR